MLQPRSQGLFPILSALGTRLVALFKIVENCAKHCEKKAFNSRYFFPEEVRPCLTKYWKIYNSSPQLVSLSEFRKKAIKARLIDV